MRYNWENKVVLITGSSQGIGKTLAIETGKRGGIIILNSRNPANLESSSRDLSDLNIEVLAVPGDVSIYEDCKRIIRLILEKYNQLDVLINNAGIAAKALIENIDPAVFQKVVDINLIGSLNMTKAAMQSVIRTGGSIFFIGSIAGVHGLGEYSAYSSSKMALTALAESLKIELSGKGVHIGIAYVGFTENDTKKIFLDDNGKRIPVPSRSNVKQMPQLQVADKIIRQIERRNFKSVISVLGKANFWMNRFFPALVHRVLLNAFRKNN